MANGVYSAWMNGAMVLNPPTIWGDVFYVDNTNGSNSNSGHDPANAFSTLNYAISKCSDSAGDCIYMCPWHAETIEDTGTASGTTTDECVIDKTHISIIGCGVGEMRPKFTLEGATDAALVVTAATTNVLIDNIIVESNLADVGDGITFSATSDGCTVQNCTFRDGAADEELVTAIAIAANCDDMAIVNCVISTFAGGGCAAGIELAGGSDRIKIIGNVIQGTFSAAPLDADAAASTEMIVMHNVFTNQGALAGGFHADCTGINAYNNYAGTTSIAAALNDSSKMWNFENYVTGEDGNSGLLDPGADADA